jgi:hypothetical protein
VSQRRLPAEIYWRRRLLVLAAGIALVWGVLHLVGGGGDDPKAQPTPTPTSTGSPTPQVTARVDGPVPVTLVSASRPCDPEKIRMTPTVEPDQRVKGPVDIGLVVSSTEATACTLTPDDADLVVVISANGTPIWDSTVCKTSLLDDPVAVSPQWATLVTATWSGRGSGSKCSAKEGYASPGGYAVQVGTLGGEPGKTTFDLKTQAKAKAKATPTRTTRKTPSPKGTTKPND